MIYDSSNFPELPPSWNKILVEDVFESIGTSNKKLKTKDALPEGKYPVVDQGQEAISGYSNNPSLLIYASDEKPIILFGDHTRAIKYIHFQFVPGADGTKLICPTGLLEPRFAFQMLRGIKLPDKGYARHYQYLRTSAIPLAPLPEQKRIADKLDATLARVDACRERLARVGPILKRFRQSVLAAAVSGRLTADWRAQQASNDSPPASTGHPTATTEPASGNPAHTGSSDVAYRSTGYETNSASSALTTLNTIREWKQKWLTDNSSHNEASRVKKRLDNRQAVAQNSELLPDTWCWTTLEDIVLMVVDCHNKTAPYETTGIPLIRTSNIRNGMFIWDDLRFVSDETYLFWSKRCFPEPGDIIFTREAPMGEAAIIPSGKKLCLGQRTMLIRPIEELAPAKYILAALLDPNFKERSAKIAVGTGVKHYRVGDVSELLIPLAPTEEQHEIVSRVESLFAFADRLEARLQAAQTAAEQLTPALLAKAFRGELVPQDPADEPASELLKRLAASRASADKPKRSRTPRQPA